jgi:hypothetical protein
MTEYNLTIKKYGTDIKLDVPVLKGDKSLRKLDELTTRFEDRTGLMFYLSDNGVIKYDDTSLTPMVGFNVAGFSHKTEVLYEADRPYLDSSLINDRIIKLGKRLVDGIREGILSQEDIKDDINLVNIIISTYRNHPLYRQHIISLENYIDDLKTGVFDLDRACKFQFALMVILDTELSDIYRNRTKRDNYRSVRTLGYLISAHDKTVNPPEKKGVLKYEQLMIPGFEELYTEVIQRKRKKD